MAPKIAPRLAPPHLGWGKSARVCFMPVYVADLELRAVLHLGLARTSVGVADLEHAGVAAVGQLHYNADKT